MILYVTSFNKAIHDRCGERMVESFLEHRPQGSLYVAAENLPAPFGAWNDPSRGVIARDITSSPFMSKWLYQNRDVIPKQFGGEYEGEKQSWWNRNAACWFRKIVALQDSGFLWQGGQTAIRYVVWLDADCLFLKGPDRTDLEKWFDGTGCFYMQGPRRKHPETSIVGYDLAAGGDKVLMQLIRQYEMGLFREDDRWDDCWQLMKAIERTKIPAKDIFGGYGKVGRVVEHSHLKEFFSHDKGINKKQRAGMLRKGRFWE